jgi:hypothetical protein
MMKNDPGTRPSGRSGVLFDGISKGWRFIFSRDMACLLVAFVAFLGALSEECHPADTSVVSLSGLLEMRYDGRFLSGGEDDDQKLYQVLDLHVEEMQWGHFRCTLSADMAEDLDGTKDDQGVDRTTTIRDTWDSSTHGFLYVLHGEVYELGPLDYLRLGRQYVRHELGTSHVDGIDCMLKLDIWGKRVKPFAYAGFPVRLYDSADDFQGQAFGLGTDFYFDPWTRMTLEHQCIKEEPDMTGSYRAGEETRYEQSAVALRRELSHKCFGYLSLYLLDTSARHMDTGFSFLFDNVDLQLDASYFYQFKEIQESPSLVSPYTGLVGVIKPYHDVRLDVTKGVYKDFIWLSAGTHWRLLDSGEEETEFNHSYNNEYLAVIVEGFPWEGIRFSVDADFWEVMESDNDDSVFTVGGLVSYETSEMFRLSAGSSYSLFSYNYFADEQEKTGVYSIHLDVCCFFQRGLYFDVRYELDIHDIDEHRVITALGIEL